MPKTKMIKTFEEACALQGYCTVEEIPFAEPKNGRQKAANAFAKLTVIAEALNESWVPDWDNWNESKYYPWFNMRSESAGGSGLGFSFHDIAYVYSGTCVGSRLVFKSRALAEYAGKQFTDIYRDLMVIEKEGN
jgi:hypothetical protein